MPPASPSRPGVVWSWLHALLGLAYAAPAAILTTIDPERGLPLAMGVICSAILGLPADRHERVRLVLVGTLAGVSMFLGSLVSAWAVLAVGTVFVLCVAVSVTHQRLRLGAMALGLGLPLVGAGLSETPAEGAGVAALMIAGSVYAWLVSLLFPEREVPASGTAPASHAPQQPPPVLLDYGIRLGLTGSLAAAAGFALSWDHPGWACTAGLLVARPSPELTTQRGTGRTLAVLAGASAALIVQLAGPSDLFLGVLVAVALGLAAGTAGSRWYISGGFTSCIVLTMLATGEPIEDAGFWFAERVAATLIGAGLAYFFMVFVPARRDRRAGRSASLALD